MNDTLELVRRFFPMDRGPIYQETPLELTHWLVEPWNAISSLFIILPGIYFLYKLRGQYLKHILLTLCIPLLILGGTGSTLFHAFRTEPVFLVLDVLPTLLLFLLVIAYLWHRVTNSIWLSIGIILGLIGISFAIFTYFPPGYGVNIAYAMRGIIFLLPLVIILARTQYKHAAVIIGAVVFFGLALLFRGIDKDAGGVLPMGTHFLWHVSTGIGGLLVAEYMYRLNGLRMETLRMRGQKIEVDLERDSGEA